MLKIIGVKAVQLLVPGIELSMCVLHWFTEFPSAMKLQLSTVVNFLTIYFLLTDFPFLFHYTHATLLWITSQINYCTQILMSGPAFEGAPLKTVTIPSYLNYCRDAYLGFCFHSYSLHQCQQNNQDEWKKKKAS